MKKEEIKTNDINAIVELLNKNTKAYYNGEECIDDDSYDSLKNKLRTLDTSNHIFDEVGTTPREERAKAHRYPMLSILDVKEPKDAVKWINNLYDRFAPNVEIDERTVYVELKVDGTSGSLHYDKKGRFLYAVTRGDGKIGNEVVWPNNKINTFIAPNVILWSKNDNIDSAFEIRGEFVIFKGSREEEPLLVGKSLRNVCSGALNRLEDSPIINQIRFIPYQIWTEKDGLLSWERTQNLIDALGTISRVGNNSGMILEHFRYDTQRELILVSEIESYYMSYLSKRDKSYLFETDGLVLTFPAMSKYKEIDKAYVSKTDHRYNLALKPPAKKATTILTNIEWDVSRTGRIIPVGVLEPIKISDVTISNLTLNNKQFVMDNNITIGSIIELERAGEVIPRFLRVIEPGDGGFNIPSKCPICDSGLKPQGVDLICVNPECQGKLIQEIVYFLKELHGAEGIAENTVKKIVSNSKPKIKNLVDFYEFILLDKFDYIINGEIEQDNIYNAVKNTLNEISELSLIEGLGLPGIRRSKLMKMGIYTVANLKSFKFRPGMGETEKKVAEWIKNKSNIDKLNKYYTYFKKYLKERIVPKEGGWKICATGKFPISRKELIKRIEKYGHIYSNQVTPSTRYLINDDNEDSKKMRDATQYGVHIIPMQEFFDLLDAK